MNEDNAQDWIRERFGTAEYDLCANIAALVRQENVRQNLISASTIASVWSRHIVDSAQLIRLAPREGCWVDIGTGAGFPGLVVAALRPEPTVLIEPRVRRAEFLSAAATALGLGHVTVQQCIAQKAVATTTVISARAVARLSTVFEIAFHMTSQATQWLIPKGGRARDEIAMAQRDWHGVFHVEQSVTASTSMIVVASQVRPR